MKKRASVIRYQKPKILLVDMPPSCEKVLREAGYNVAIGSFGTPYCVEPCDTPFFVSLESSRLPGYEEQEIVIANTDTPEISENTPAEEAGEGVPAFWQVGTSGVIDPRPLCMHRVCASFDRIQEHGTIFVIFIGDRYEIKYGHGPRYSHTVRIDHELKLDSWSFLTDLALFKSRNAHGSEMSFSSNDFASLLKRGANEGQYYSLLSPHYSREEHWLSVVKNKFEETVGGILIYGSPKRHVVILPQMPDAHRILLELLQEWCSQWCPSRFPDLEGARWIHRPEYEVPRIVELRGEIEIVKHDASESVKKLNEKIEEVTEQNADWYSLLRETGPELVGAVIRTLRKLGFTQVVDVDEEAKARGENASLREDIQVRDKSPLLVIDVKGVTGKPDDDESRQAEKHAIMRIQELQRADVKALTIINHQRNLPPDEREEQPFRKEIVKYAEETRLGLMTSWDLFRLMRNAENLRWSPENVLPIFYRTGRIDPIPEHYHNLGMIVDLWAPAFGIVPSRDVRVGQRLAVEVADTFEEFVVESLQIDGQTVHEARTGSDCGVAFPNSSSKFRKGARVFLVRD